MNKYKELEENAYDAIHELVADYVNKQLQNDIPDDIMTQVDDDYYNWFHALHGVVLYNILTNLTPKNGN